MEYALYVSLGSNIEPSPCYLKKALELLSKKFTFKRVSSVYKTAPQDDIDQSDFYNLCALFHTTIDDPFSILELIQTIEKEIGRQKDPARPKGPRTIDIDILLFGDFIINEIRLTIPHPSMMDRNFVLIPLLEITEGYDEELISRFDLEKRISDNISQKVERIENPFDINCLE